MLQVEIKLRLPNKEAHDKVADALKDSYIETHDQENFFFEGSEKELSKAKLSLRTRFYGVDKKCQITMKVCTSYLQESRACTVHSQTNSVCHNVLCGIMPNAAL